MTTQTTKRTIQSILVDASYKVTPLGPNAYSGRWTGENGMGARIETLGARFEPGMTVRAYLIEDIDGTDPVRGLAQTARNLGDRIVEYEPFIGNNHAVFETGRVGDKNYATVRYDVRVNTLDDLAQLATAIQQTPGTEGED